MKNNDKLPIEQAKVRLQKWEERKKTFITIYLDKLN